MNHLRSITFDPDNIGEFEEYAFRQRHSFFQKLMSFKVPSDSDEEQIEWRVHGAMEKYIKERSVPVRDSERHRNLWQLQPSVSACGDIRDEASESVREAQAPVYHNAGWCAGASGATRSGASARAWRQGPHWLRRGQWRNDSWSSWQWSESEGYHWQCHARRSAGDG